jgi:cell division protein FtsI (penicillin-binding protein 3)
MADEATPQLAQVSQLASETIDGGPSQRVITDRNGVVLDAATTPALAYLRAGRSVGEQPLQLSLDAKANQILEQELASGLERFSAHAAAGFIMEVNTGEIIALSSIESGSAQPRATISRDGPVNRVTQSVYESGSSAKLMTIAMALDTGKASMASHIDARSELHYGPFTIHDYRPARRMLTIPEVVQYSSNIAITRLALRVGTTEQKAFLTKMGQLDSPQFDGIEATPPIVPTNWTGLEAIATSFGRGLAVSPLQAGVAVATLVNGGTVPRPTFFKRIGQTSDQAGQRVISAATSEKMRYLLRFNVEKGSAKFANVPGYDVGGATGTTEKIVNGDYAPGRVVATFTGIYPANKPKYILVTVLDEPQALPDTHGLKTAPWNAATIGARVIERTAPILGVEYRATAPAAPLPL